ncbi:hypothetical protein [Amycolatopsis sp. H20-H5]|uniref:hypothetical protein n=1 Tax=Amycolatopsis sp. H20-H5 TaxID=3046309 RepID=UPI002DB7405E|nr:hypothetical protein [Amycolatopsis sp. H20-H5]MEC3979843.1 hypothetical protein [Amycolatopsis sp. H20-H5]
MTYQPHPATRRQPEPSGATANCAGVLALLGGIWNLLGFAVQLFAMVFGHWTFGQLISVVINLVVTGLLLSGGIQLFRRKPNGRSQTILGCALVILDAVAGVVLLSVGVSWPGGYAASVLGSTFALLFTAPAIATLVLAAVPSTARWVGSPLEGRV